MKSRHVHAHITQ